jgi:hypothetical protein
MVQLGRRVTATIAWFAGGRGSTLQRNFALLIDLDANVGRGSATEVFALQEPSHLDGWIPFFKVLSHDSPTNVDEARDTLRITQQIMAFGHRDRWKYTAKEYDQWLKGHNPHGSRFPRRARWRSAG